MEWTAHSRLWSTQSWTTLTGVQAGPLYWCQLQQFGAETALVGKAKDLGGTPLGLHLNPSWEELRPFFWPVLVKTPDLLVWDQLPSCPPSFLERLGSSRRTDVPARPDSLAWQVPSDEESAIISPSHHPKTLKQPSHHRGPFGQRLRCVYHVNVRQKTACIRHVQASVDAPHLLVLSRVSSEESPACC